jgi:hypothetical protein
LRASHVSNLTNPTTAPPPPDTTKLNSLQTKVDLIANQIQVLIDLMNKTAAPEQQPIQQQHQQQPQQPIYQYPPQHQMHMHPYQQMPQLPMHHQMPLAYRNRKTQMPPPPPQHVPPPQDTSQQAALPHSTPTRQNTLPHDDNAIAGLTTAGLKATGLSPNAKRNNTNDSRKEPDAKRTDNKETLTKKDNRKAAPIDPPNNFDQHMTNPYAQERPLQFRHEGTTPQYTPHNFVNHEGYTRQQEYKQTQGPPNHNALLYSQHNQPQYLQSSQYSQRAPSHSTIHLMERSNILQFHHRELLSMALCTKMRYS